MGYAPTFQAASVDTCAACSSTGFYNAGKCASASVSSDTSDVRIVRIRRISFQAPSPGFILRSERDRRPAAYRAAGSRNTIPSPPSATTHRINSEACSAPIQSHVAAHSTPSVPMKARRSEYAPGCSGASKATKDNPLHSPSVADARRYTDKTRENPPRPAHRSPSSAILAGREASHHAGASMRWPSLVQSVSPSHTARMPSNFYCISHPVTFCPAYVLASIGLISCFILQAIYSHANILQGVF